MYDVKIIAYGCEKCAPDKAVVRQVYPCNSIHYVLSGHGYFNGIYLGPGEGFVGMKNAFCEYYPDPGDPWEYMFFRIGGEDAAEVLDSYGISAPPCVFSYNFEKRVVMIGSMIQETIPDFKPGKVPYLLKDSMKSEAFAKLLLSYHKPVSKKSSEHKKSLREIHVEEAENYIVQNYQRKLTMDEIAEEMHLSRGYLRNIFQEYRGISPRDYVVKMRIARAKELLTARFSGGVKGSVNISTIAYSVGYDDVLQFSKLFKKHTGVSPSEYRKSHI